MNRQRIYRLEAGFREPPIEARPKNYWWCLNGYTDTTTLIHELEAILTKS
ncbi:MAG: hypothetical protein ACNS62_04740 [Candidatus Cyclobacteriaceae bacterium M3_2C_046]